jgi:peptide/nickel transport system permease protein
MLQKIGIFWKRYKKSMTGVVGLAIIFFLVVVALFADVISLKDPFAISVDSFLPPSSSRPMGTDDLGRDIFSGVVYGSRLSLLIGFLTAGASTLMGILIGGFSGYYGGKIDDFLMRLTEFFQVVPRFFLALIIIALFGSNIWNIILVLSILSWPVTARLVRAEALKLRDQDFVMAARAIGCSDRRIVFGHVLPNAMAPVIVNTSVQIAWAIILEAGLSFLGLGDPSTMSWGVMLLNGQQSLRQAWWIATFPGIGIFLAVLGFNLVGDGLNDALNPRLKNRREGVQAIGIHKGILEKIKKAYGYNGKSNG